MAATLLLLVAAGVLSTALWVLRWETTPLHAYPDSFWYVKQAATFSGMPDGEAGRFAARTVCERGHPPVEGWTTCQDGIRTYAEGFSDRYNRILDTRPAYPLLAAPFVAVFGGQGITLSLLMLGVLSGMAAALIVRLLGGTWVQSLAAVVLLYLMPTGYWMTRILGEGGALAATMVTLCAATALLRAPAGRARLVTAGLTGAGLFWTTLMKPANGMLLCAALAGVAAVIAIIALVRRRRPEPPTLTLLGVGLGIALLWQLISLVFDLPGINETLQDKYTEHFTTPEVSDPWARLWEQNRSYWSFQLDFWLNEGQPLKASPIMAFLLGGAYVVSRVLPWRDALLWLAAGATGLGAVLAHPLWTEVDRLMMFIWLPMVVGFAMVGRGRNLAEPAEHTGPVPDQPTVPRQRPHGDRPAELMTGA